MRGVSILERLAGLCDGVLQSFTQKPQSPTHREMTVAGGTASAQDSSLSATARTDAWLLHAAALSHRPCTRVRAHVIVHVMPAPYSCSMRALRFSRMSSRTGRAQCGRRAVAHASAGPRLFVTLPFLPFPPARSARTGKMRAFVARPGCQTVARRQSIVPSNYIVRAIRAITIRR